MAKPIQNISNHVIIPKTCRERFVPLVGPALAPLRDLGVESAGVSDLVAPFRIARTSPNFHVAIFTLGGRAAWRTAHEHGSFQPGTLWWAPAGTGYEYWAQAQSTWRVVWFHLRRQTRGAAELLSRQSSHGQRIAEACAGLLAELHHTSSGSDRAARAYAEILIVLLQRELRSGTRTEPTAQTRRLEAVFQRVEENLQHPWRVDELAKELHVSLVHFHRLVSRAYGTSPLALINALRMRQAREYLLQTDYKLQHIAELVGFQTPFSFSRAFKQHTGSSPRELRRRK